MSRNIKTRETVKDIKILDKSANLAGRMKDGLIKTKEKAEETREHRHNSPTEYATDNIQEKTGSAVRETVHHLPNPANKARENMERARSHFEEVRRQTPEARRQAAQQAQETANTAADNADRLRQTADQAGERARDAKEAVRDAKQNLREVRETGRQTIRDAKLEAAREVETPRQPSAPRQTVQSSPNTAQKQFQIKRFEQMREQRRASEQAEKIADGAKTDAGQLHDATSHAGEPAKVTNEAVRDVRQSVPESGQFRRQPAGEVRPDTVHYLDNSVSSPQQPAGDNPNPAQKRFQIKRFADIKERRRAAEQAEKTANKVKTDNGRLPDASGKAGEPARVANEPPKDTNQPRHIMDKGVEPSVSKIGQDTAAHGADYPISTPRQTPETPSQPISGLKEKRFRIKQRGRAAEQAEKTANMLKPDAVPQSSDVKGNMSLEHGGITEKTTIRTGDTIKSDLPRAQSRASDMARQKAGKLSGQSPKTLNSGAAPQKTGSISGGKPASAVQTTGKTVNAQSSHVSKDFLRPTYMNKGVTAARNTEEASKTLQTTAKTSKKAIKSTQKGLKETAKGTVKTVKKSVKTAEQSAKAAVKTAQQTAKTAHKTAQASAKAAKAAAHAAKVAAKAAAAAKATVKAVIAMVKAIIAAVKGLVAAIAAGGWVAVLVIVIICLVALLVGSIFGIFFSGESNPDTGQNVNTVIAEIDAEYTARIDNIIAANYHDSLDMSGARAWWKHVLAVYTVRTVSDPDNPMEVAMMTNEKAAILRTVFWDMNTVSYWIETIEHTETSSYTDDEGNEYSDSWTWYEYILHIIVTHKLPDEMAEQYGFNGEQKEWLDELLKPEYNSLWNALLYGIGGTGDGTMIGVADTQIGNVGGEIYWRWYGFDSRVEWCAIFVSWVADQCGYIDAGILPMFSACSDGVQWFQDRGQWQDGGYTPMPGDIIFFDWEPDGTCDHVGIVESVSAGVVNTIEGNSSDSCRRRSYDLASDKIFGYGVPVYN